MQTYVLYMLTTLVFLFVDQSVKSSTSFRKVLLLLYFLIFTFVFSFRYNSGVDWFNYIRKYEAIVYHGSYFLSFEYLYDILNLISYYLGFGFQGVIFMTSTLFFVFIWLFVKRSGVNFYSFFLCVSPFLLCFVLANLTRQAISISIILFSLTYLLERKMFHFVFFVMVSGLFHTSSLLFIVLPVLFLKFRYLLFIGGMVLSLVFFIFLHRYERYFSGEIASLGVYLRLLGLLPFLLFVFRPFRGIGSFSR